MTSAATLLLDLGNTRLKAAILRDGQPHDIAHFPLEDRALEAAFAAWFMHCVHGEVAHCADAHAGEIHLPACDVGASRMHASNVCTSDARVGGVQVQDLPQDPLAPLVAARDVTAPDASAREISAIEWPASDPATTTRLPRACLAAVAPDAIIARIMAMLRAHRIQARRVTTQPHVLGLRIAYENPARLGVDRWLNLVAARRRVAGPVLVASVGTALTIDALLADGRHLGGLIAASPELSRAALVARAPRLEVPRGRIVRFAANTEDAIESGAVLAAGALIERSLHELERHAAGPATLLLTGGGAAPLRPWLPAHRAVDDLVLHGLAAWVDAQAR